MISIQEEFGYNSLEKTIGLRVIHCGPSLFDIRKWAIVGM